MTRKSALRANPIMGRSCAGGWPGACARSGRDRRQAGDPRPAGSFRTVRPACRGCESAGTGSCRRSPKARDGPGTSPAAAPGATGGEPQGPAGLDGHTPASLAELQASRPTRCVPRCCRCRRIGSRRRGHRHRGGRLQLGVGGRAIVAGVPRGAGARDPSDHPAADTLRTTLLKSSANSNPPSVDRPAH